MKLWRSDGVGEAIIERIDEDDAAVLELADIVGVELPGDKNLARHVAGVKHIVDLLVGLQDALELQDLEQRRQQDRVLVRNANPHGLAEEALIHQQPAVDVLAEQIELAGLIGRDGEPDLLRPEEPGKPRRYGIGDLLLCRLGCLLRRRRGHVLCRLGCLLGWRRGGALLTSGRVRLLIADSRFRVFAPLDHAESPVYRKAL